jgi:hypothetical protein
MKKTYKLHYVIRGALILAGIFFPVFFITESSQFIFIPFFVIWDALGFRSVAHLIQSALVALPIGWFTPPALRLGVLNLLLFAFYVCVGALLGWIYGVSRLSQEKRR